MAGQAGKDSGRDIGTGPIVLNSIKHYPRALATHNQIVQDVNLFFSTLLSLLQYLGLPLKIPKIANQEIDIHRLYIEVTNRGGLEAVMANKLFVAVCEPFNFPASFTNKSFVVRKLYCNVLHHYEQLYYFGKEGRPLIPVPVSEQQQQQQRARSSGGSPIKRNTATRSKSGAGAKPTLSVNPGTPRGNSGAVTSARDERKLAFPQFSSVLSGNSPVNSPNGKRKPGMDVQIAPPPPSLTGMGMGGPPGLMGRPSMKPMPMGGPPGMIPPGMMISGGPTGPAFKQPMNMRGASNLKITTKAAGLDRSSTPGQLGDGMGLNGLGALPGQHATSPSTSCTSGAPQVAPPVLAPPGLESGLEFPCRIMAVYDNCYIISMHLPGVPPMVGQLMTCLPPNMSLIPNMLPHQMVCSRPKRFDGMMHGIGNGKDIMMSGPPGPMGMPPMMHTGMMPPMGPMPPGFGGPGGPPGSMFPQMPQGRPLRPGMMVPHPDAGLGLNMPGMPPQQPSQRMDQEEDLLSLGTVFPDPSMGFDSLSRDWDNCSAGDMLADEEAAAADATAAIVAQYSPTMHREGAKKVRLRSNGGYAVVNDHGWSSGPSLNAHNLSTAGSAPTAGPGSNKESSVPQQPRSAFMFFMAHLNAMGPERLGGRPLQEVAAEMWETMNAEQKEPFQVLAKRDYERFMRDQSGFLNHGSAHPMPDQKGSFDGTCNSLFQGVPGPRMSHVMSHEGASEATQINANQHTTGGASGSGALKAALMTDGGSAEQRPVQREGPTAGSATNLPDPAQVQATQSSMAVDNRPGNSANPPGVGSQPPATQAAPSAVRITDDQDERDCAGHTRADANINSNGTVRVDPKDVDIKSEGDVDGSQKQRPVDGRDNHASRQNSLLQTGGHDGGNPSASVLGPGSKGLGLPAHSMPVPVDSTSRHSLELPFGGPRSGSHPCDPTHHLRFDMGPNFQSCFQQSSAFLQQGPMHGSGGPGSAGANNSNMPNMHNFQMSQHMRSNLLSSEPLMLHGMNGGSKMASMQNPRARMHMQAMHGSHEFPPHNGPTSGPGRVSSFPFGGPMHGMHLSQHHSNPPGLPSWHSVPIETSSHGMHTSHLDPPMHHNTAGSPPGMHRPICDHDRRNDVTEDAGLGHPDSAHLMHTSGQHAHHSTDHNMAGSAGQNAVGVSAQAPGSARHRVSMNGFLKGLDDLAASFRGSHGGAGMNKYLGDTGSIAADLDDIGNADDLLLHLNDEDFEQMALLEPMDDAAMHVAHDLASPPKDCEDHDTSGQHIAVSHGVAIMKALSAMHHACQVPGNAFAPQRACIQDADDVAARSVSPMELDGDHCNNTSVKDTGPSNSGSSLVACGEGAAPGLQQNFQHMDTNLRTNGNMSAPMSPA